MTITLCTTCNGDGLVGRKVCGTCRGAAAVAELAGFALYWGKRIDSFEISLDRIRRVVSAVLTVALSLVSALGVGTFAWYFVTAVRF